MSLTKIRLSGCCWGRLRLTPISDSLRDRLVTQKLHRRPSRIVLWPHRHPRASPGTHSMKLFHYMTRKSVHVVLFNSTTDAGCVTSKASAWSVRTITSWSVRANRMCVSGLAPHHCFFDVIGTGLNVDNIQVYYHQSVGDPNHWCKTPAMKQEIPIPLLVVH